MDSRKAYLLSAFFHPLFLNFYGFLMLFLTVPYLQRIYSGQGLLIITAIYFLNNVLMPLLAVNLMKSRGILHSYEMESRAERRLPLLFISLLYLASFYLFRQLNLNAILINYLLGSAATVIFTSLVNSFYKLSIHGIALGGLLGVIFSLCAYSGFDSRWLFISLCLLSGLVASARLFAQAHQPAQIYWAMLAGFCIMWVVL